MMADYRQGCPSRSFLILRFRSLTIGGHCSWILPFLRVLAKLELLAVAVTQSCHCRYVQASLRFEMPTKTSGSRQLPVTSRDGQADGHTTLCLIGASLSEPHINGTSMLAIYVWWWYVRHPRATSQTLDLTLGRMQCFVLKSLCVLKTTATVCSNLRHLCNISPYKTYISVWKRSRRVQLFSYSV